MKVAYAVETGKVVIDVSGEYKMDSDADGKASVSATSTNHVEIDTYELATEIMKKDSAVLELVLKQLNYKPA